MSSIRKLRDCSRLAAIVGMAVAFVLSVGATGLGQPGQGQCCYPFPGQFKFPTSALIEAQFGPMPVRLNLLGPTMVQTKPPNPNEPTVIPTEMLALDLSGTSPLGGGVGLHLISGTSTMGQTQGMQSFFDVFTELSFDNAPWLPAGQGDILYVGFPDNQYLPVHVTNDNLTCIPPQPGAHWSTPPPPYQVPLTSRRLNQIIGQLTLVGHTVLPTNHFKTWAVTDPSPPLPRTVRVRDQFMQDILTLDSIIYLSNPVQKDNFNIADTTDHFTWYRAVGNPAPFQVEFENQFQRSTILIDSVKYFLLPTQKFPHNPPKLLDHYKAYRIRNAQPFTRTVRLLDQFDLTDPRGPEIIDVLLPRYFLTPAQKQIGPLPEPVYDTLTHYVAYEINPKRQTILPVALIRDTKDQFGLHSIRIDSSVFVLVPTCKLRAVPQEEACCLPDGSCVLLPPGECAAAGGTVVPACLGDGDGNGKDDACEQPCPPGPVCDSTVVPKCLVMCPASDIPYTITLKDCFGNPVGGYPAGKMWIDFSQCPCACPCPEETSWPLVYPNGPSNALGEVTWYVDAGYQCLCAAPCVVTVNIVLEDGSLCQIPIQRIRTTDSNCNHVVDNTDFQFGDETCSDFNCDGITDLTDEDFFRKHLGHHCVPCDQFREEIRMLDCVPNRLKPGDTCSACLIVFNNTPDTCYIDSLILQQAGFAATPPGWTRLAKLIPPLPDSCIPPGVTDTVCFQYIVPPAGHGCIQILKYSDCCNDTTQLNLDVEDDPFNCGRRCDTFRIPLDVPAGAQYCVVPVENLPPTWTVTYVPPLPACFTQSTVLTVIICTDDSPLKGQQGCVTLVVTDPAGRVVGKAAVCKNIACQRGDASDDGRLSGADIVLELNATFQGTAAPAPETCLDMNGDGRLSGSDIVLLLFYVFNSQPPPGCQ